ncbi:hypothetical protein Tcan_05753 [Toxocara canis]|uniref:Uncharacterized protein n=1 Tax=Toxocara canis TaxID=6265 RepID=A0A0B2VW66_TOXCA|nr:hypothetical protein Tcan_05753 [Toxocara canis]
MKQRAQSTPRWHQVLGAVVGEKGRGLKGRIIGKKGRERGEGPASEPRGQTLKCRLCERQGSVIDRRTDHTIYEVGRSLLAHSKSTRRKTKTLLRREHFSNVTILRTPPINHNIGASLPFPSPYVALL